MDGQIFSRRATEACRTIIRCDGTVSEVANVICAARKRCVTVVARAERLKRVQQICSDIVDVSGSAVKVFVESDAPGAAGEVPHIERFDIQESLDIVCGAMRSANEAYDEAAETCDDPCPFELAETSGPVCARSTMLEHVIVCPRFHTVDVPISHEDASLVSCMTCDACLRAEAYVEVEHADVIQ